MSPHRPLVRYRHSALPSDRASSLSQLSRPHVTTFFYFSIIANFVRLGSNYFRPARQEIFTTLDSGYLQLDFDYEDRVGLALTFGACTRLNRPADFLVSLGLLRFRPASSQWNSARDASDEKRRNEKRWAWTPCRKPRKEGGRRNGNASPWTASIERGLDGRRICSTETHGMETFRPTQRV